MRFVSKDEYSDAYVIRIFYKFFGGNKLACPCIDQQTGSRGDEMTHEPKSCAEEPQWAAFLAIDWADREHVWILQPAGGGTPERGRLEQKPEAIELWATQLAARFGDRPIAVALEQSCGAVVFALTKYGHLHLYPIHPSTLAHFRQALTPSGAKNDPADTALLLELLVHHRSRLRRLQPDTEQTRELQFLVEVRRRLVDDKTRFTNRLTAQLKLYYPQVLNWFYKLSSPVACEFLSRWPTLESAQKARPSTLRTFFLRHNCKDEEGRLQEIRAAVPATHDQAVVRSGALMVQATVRLIQNLKQDITCCEERIEHLTTSHPDFAIFDSLPGAGAALVPRLIAGLGSRRERFSSAGEIQSYTGIAPVVKQSGRRAYPRFLRQTFHEWAAHTIQSSVWARAFYERQLARGNKHHAAVRALAYKWIRIRFRCWKDQMPYVESFHSNAQQRRHHEANPVGSTTVNLQWKSVAGFHKIAGINT
jgi:transposase